VINRDCSSNSIRDFATLAEPLRKLTRKEVKWQWNSEQKMAFETLKQRLTSADVMSYYNQNAETNIIVDGSPFGLGAILNQKQSDGNFKPVAYASTVGFYGFDFGCIWFHTLFRQCMS
jgi:hypothetical protein